MLCLRFLAYATVVAAFGGRAMAQLSQINQARQFGSTRGTLGAAATEPAATACSVPDQGTDEDSFGVQQILRESERMRPFRLFADVSGFATNNVALTRRGQRADAFLLATFGFEYRRPLPHGFQLEATVRGAMFNYNRYTKLDFTSLDAGVGLTYLIPKVAGLSLFARYNYNELISAETDDVFFKNHTITLGIQESVAFSQAHYAYVGLSGQVGFADPVIAERDEFAAFAGYHAQLTRHLDTDLLYRFGVYPYTKGDRLDRNHSVSLGLRYCFTEWLSISASGFASWNRSNRPVFDYNAANAGGGLSLSLRF